MITLDTITLPADLEWIDEHEWSAVGQTKTYSLTGALLIEEAHKQAGRPITLQGGKEAAWVEKTVVQALQAKADTPGLAMTLDYHGTPYAVMFNRESGAALSARLVERIADPGPSALYYLTIKLMEI